MKPVRLTSSSKARELDHFRIIYNVDMRLEEEFKLFPTTGRIPPNGNPILRHPGVNFRKRSDRLLGLYLYWNTKFLRFLILEELEKGFDIYEEDFNLRLAGKASLRDKTFFEFHFFSQFSERDFFGNFVPRVEKLIRLWRISCSLPPESKKKIRRRGYPTSVRRQLRIPLNSHTSCDYTIKWPDSEAQYALETSRLCERLLLLNLVMEHRERAGT